MLCSALPNMSAEAGFSEASDPFYSEDPLAAGSEEEDQTFAALLTAASLPAPTRAASVFHACAGTAGASEATVVPEDWVRNFLLRAGMERTAECFEAEWFEGQLALEAPAPVPDAFARCESLEEAVRTLRSELACVRGAACTAAEGWERLRQERNQHRLHGKRLAQEKERLLLDAKRLRLHYAQFEPTIQELRSKFELATREASRLRLERERLAAALQVLKGAAPAAGCAEAGDAPPARPPPAQKAVVPSGSAAHRVVLPAFALLSGPDAPLTPTPPPAAAALASCLSPCRSLSSADGASFSCLASHPSKPLLASGCDSGGWRVWALPGGEQLLSGEGHRSWVSACAFRPGGVAQLATGGGDGAVKLWDLNARACVATLGGERGSASAVWALDFQDDDGGAACLLASACLDRCCRVWDAVTAKLLTTLRGHVDSCNYCAWQGGGGSALATSCGDHAVRVWDVRQGRPACTLQGHLAAVNCLAWAPLSQVAACGGAQLATADLEGQLRMWDLRAGSTVHSLALGSAVNRLAWDASTGMLAAACEDGALRLVDARSGKLLAALRSHSGPVQAVVYAAGSLVSAGADGAKVWAAEP